MHVHPQSNYKRCECKARQVAHTHPKQHPASTSVAYNIKVGRKGNDSAVRQPIHEQSKMHKQCLCPPRHKGLKAVGWGANMQSEMEIGREAEQKDECRPKTVTQDTGRQKPIWQWRKQETHM